MQSTDHSLNVSLVNHFLRKGVIVILQWPREAGAVYCVNVLPLTELTNATSQNSMMINLTISYGIQYNVSILSSLCGVTTTRVFKYSKLKYEVNCHYAHTLMQLHAVTCDLPTQLLQHPVIVDTGPHDNPHIEGQFITYTCPPGFALNGSNASVCTGNGKWDPDPREVDCIGDYFHNDAINTVECMD